MEQYFRLGDQIQCIDAARHGLARELEGADLRKLDSFLKNNDLDKTLGSLYRITTNERHAKWVYLNYYRSTYREGAMRNFLDIFMVLSTSM
ncbi:hypothetical protein BGZ81_000732 [Podila clonocystis]|nr:hypothetical protein BGZ81_000732 [Podila clonocystis]